MTRSIYHHGNLRLALVQAGLDILAADGLAALSLRACAARVGVSHAAPRNHFANLDTLKAAIVAEGFRQLETRMRTALERASADPHARIAAVFAGYLDFATANQDLFRLMFADDRWSEQYRELADGADACYALLREVCAPVAHEVDGAPAPATTVEVMLWSFVHGFTSLAINKQFRHAIEETGRTPTLAEATPRFPLRRRGKR